MLRTRLSALLWVVALAPVAAQQSGKLLETRLHARLAPMFEQRRKVAAAVRNADQMRAHRDGLRAKFRAVVGEFPDKTPLTNLYLSVLHKLGVPAEQIGNSTGTFAELSDL